MSEVKPLTKRNYLGLLSLVGALDAITDAIPDLDDRGQTERLTAAREATGEALSEVLRTVPPEKLKRIGMDLKHTRIYTKVEAPGITTVDMTHHRYVEAETLNRLVDYVARNECYLCDKSAKEGRHCPIRAMIEDAIPHEVGYKATDGKCKWSGLTLGLGEWEEDE